MMYPFGLIGAMLVILGWIPEYISLLRNPKAKLSFKFALIYFIGSFFLFLHALQINDSVFVAINFLAMMFSLLSLITAKMKKKLF